MSATDGPGLTPRARRLFRDILADLLRILDDPADPALERRPEPFRPATTRRFRRDWPGG